jgi:H+-transporting ATPase
MRATVIKWIQKREHERIAKAAAEAAGAPMERTVSRVQSIHESFYSNRTTFLRRTMRRFNLGRKVSVKPEELKRISSAAALSTGNQLRRHPSVVPPVPHGGIPISR